MRSSKRELFRILLLGPNRWPAETNDPEAGLQLRRLIVQDNLDLAADWLIMEDDPAPGDLTRKFLALLTDPRTTHVFLIWPREAKMVGTEDELVMWQAVSELRGNVPECYLFHERGVLHLERTAEEIQVVMDDHQGKSPYLYGILERGVYEQEWRDVKDLRTQIKEVLRGDLGVPPRQEDESPNLGVNPQSSPNRHPSAASTLRRRPR